MIRLTLALGEVNEHVELLGEVAVHVELLGVVGKHVEALRKLELGFTLLTFGLTGWSSLNLMTSLSFGES